MTRKVLDSLLGDLAGAHGRKLPWPEIVQKALAIASHPDVRQRFPHTSALTKHIAEITGYSAGVLRRMHAAYEFIQEVGPQARIKGRALDPLAGSGQMLIGALSMSKVELAKRTYDVDHTAGVAMLQAILDKDPSYRDLRHEYDVILGSPPYQQPRKAAPRVAAERNRALGEVVAANLPSFTGTKTARLFHRRYALEFVDADAVAVSVKDFRIEFVDGFDFRELSTSDSRSVLNRALAEISFRSSFFRRYWVLIRGQDEVLELARMLTRLGLDSVGLFWLGRGDELDLVRQPTKAPSPDRQRLAKEEILKAGVPRAD
jgi:hypothetical protein